MAYQTILFDMDGTVLDTVADLTDAVNHTLRAYGFPEKTAAEVVAATGNGAAVLIAACLPRGTDTPGFADILRDYRTYYQAHTCVKTAPYPGIAALLGELCRRGAKLAIVSNKPHGAASALGERFFPGVPVFGETAERRRKPAPDMVLHALAALGAEANSAVYVGDSEVDVETARNAGLPLIAVDWGFRTGEQLKAAGAACIVHTAAELGEAVFA